MNVTQCHPCTTVAADNLVNTNTNTSFIHSPSSKTNTILKLPSNSNKGSTKQVRFQMPPRYYHHHHISEAEADESTQIYQAALDSAATTNCFPATY